MVEECLQEAGGVEVDICIKGTNGWTRVGCESAQRVRRRGDVSCRM